MSRVSCPECGSRVRDGVDYCDLCGARIQQSPTNEPGEVEELASADMPVEVVYCNKCGWQNPLHSQFCSRCGSRLQDISGSPAAPFRPALDTSMGRTNRGIAAPMASPPASASLLKPDAAPSSSAVVPKAAEELRPRHVFTVVGLAVLFVAALYLITVISKSPGPLRTESAVIGLDLAAMDEAASAPVEDRYAATVDSLEGRIESLSGPEKQEARQALVAFYSSIGRIDRAASTQREIALETDRVEDWRMAGNLLYDWMELSENELRLDVALLVIDAYKRVLQDAPDDLDVRADLAWAYQYDPRNPMEAINQTNRVLEADPDHLAANFNRAIFLLRINRLDQALRQFERVKELAGSSSPYYRESEAWIESIREAGRSE